VQVGKSLSSLESGLIFLMVSHFIVWKMVQIGKSLSSPESGPKYLMDNHFPFRKMVTFMV
jgi:hypothetical protein